MEARLCFIFLCALVGLLFSIICFWRRKAGAAAFAAALLSANEKDRDKFCRLAVMAGHRNACRMFCFARSDFFEDRKPLQPFKSHGVRMTFYGHYYPSRHKDLLSDEQQEFCDTLYGFKDGKVHGIEFFKACMDSLKLEDGTYHIMFMPCSSDVKYERRFSRLDWYIGKHRPNLTSGFHDVEIFGERESLHGAKGGEERILTRNYRITGDIKGKQVIIVDDVLTTGQSANDYRKEIEKCGGKVVGAIFYGKTVEVPPLLLIRLHVWGSHIMDVIKWASKS